MVSRSTRFSLDNTNLSSYARLAQYLLASKHLNLLVFSFPMLAFCFFLVFLPSLTVGKFLLGIVAMLFVPGYLLYAAIGLLDHTESGLGFSFVLGLLIQVVNVYAAYVIDTVARFTQFNLPLFLILISSFETLVLLVILPLIRTISHPTMNRFHFKRLVLTVPSILFLLCFVLNVLLQSFNSSAILPDGALYLDSARFLVANGKFSSSVINDASLYPLQNKVGLVPHIGTALLYSVFFSIGDASYQVAKWSAALIGALLVYPVFEIAKLSFGRRAAFLAAAIIAVHPLFRYYSSILYGPEIACALFAIFSLVMLEQAISHNALRYSALSGIFLFLSNFVWGGDTAPTVGAFALMFTAASYKKSRSYHETFVQFLATSLLFGTFLIALVAYSNILLWLIMILLISGLSVLYRHLKIDNLRHLITTVSIFLVLLQLQLLRFYVHPSATPSQPRQPYLTVDIFSIADRFTSFVWPNWTTTALPIILISALVSMVWFERRAITPYSFLIAWLLARLTLQPEQGVLYVVSNERFYLSITAVFIVFSAGLISRLAFRASRTLSASMDNRLRRLAGVLTNPGLRAAVFASTVFALIIGSSLPTYSAYIDTFTANSIQENGWIPVIDWIRINTTSGDVLLTSGSPRLWAWFTNREVVGTAVPADNSLLSLDEIGPAELVLLISAYSPKFVIFDSTYQAAILILPRLYYLYGDYSPGTAFSLNSTSGSITLETVISSISTINNGTVTLYRVIT